GGVALAAVLAALAIWGPQLSPRETAWLRDYAVQHERVGSGVLGDPANIATAVAAAFLLWKRRFRLVAASAASLLGLVALFALLPRAGLDRVGVGPLTLGAVTRLS